MRIFNDAWLPTGSGTRGRHVSLQAGGNLSAKLYSRLPSMSESTDSGSSSSICDKKTDQIKCIKRGLITIPPPNPYRQSGRDSHTHTHTHARTHAHTHTHTHTHRSQSDGTIRTKRNTITLLFMHTY